MLLYLGVRYFERALQFKKEGDLEKAEKDFQSAKDLWKEPASQDNPMALYHLGRMYEEQGDLDQARSCYKREKIAEAASEDKKIREGKAAKEKLLNLGIKYFNRALKFNKEQDLENAEKDFRSAMELKVPYAALNIALIELGRRNYQAAISAAKRALELAWHPQVEDAKKLRGDAHNLLGNIYINATEIEGHLEKAYHHFSLAEHFGHTEAKKMRELMRSGIILTQQILSIFKPFNGNAEEADALARQNKEPFSSNFEVLEFNGIMTTQYALFHCKPSKFGELSRKEQLSKLNFGFK